jgi:hypothetical protein
MGYTYRLMGFGGCVTLSRGRGHDDRQYHVPFNRWFCGYFSGYSYIPAMDILVVNLCSPFGWTGSPVHYSIAGQTIKAIHNSRPGFQNLVYCYGHILIGDGRRFETMVSAIALRRAMVTLLGTTACNEK